MTADHEVSGPIPEDELALNVRKVVAEALELELDAVQMEKSLYELGAESLDMLDMAFMLEDQYRIQFPRTDFLGRANDYFGAESLVSRGQVTDLGLQLLRIGMPELDPEELKPGLRDLDVARMIQVGSFFRTTQRLLEVKEAFPRVCPACSGVLVESETFPEYECRDCGEIVPLPSGDDVLLEDLIALHKQVKGDVEPTDTEEEAPE